MFILILIYIYISILDFSSLFVYLNNIFLDFAQLFVHLNNIFLDLEPHLMGQYIGVYFSTNEGTVPDLGTVSDLGTNMATNSNTSFIDYLERKAHYYLRTENGVNTDGRVYWQKINLSQLQFNFDSKLQLFYEDTRENGKVCKPLSELYHTKRYLFNQVQPDKTDVWGIIDHFKEK